VQKQGDVLFTSYGISGLAILDISRFVMEELIHTPTVTLEIDLMPKMSREQLFSLMKKSLVKKSSKPLKLWMQGFINKKLIDTILEPLKLQNKTVSLLSSNIKELEKIVDKIKIFKFTVNGSRGYKGAEVATGGVDTKEINPRTMESKKHKGLYFTGEVLDVDGDRGGFNLYFAWVCGLRAGEAI
jgi:predicted Rossmann fold flavoprotein